MTVVFLDSNKVEGLRNAINNDTEFKLAARFMSEDVLLEVDDSRCIVKVHDGVITEIKLNPPSDDHWCFSIKARAALASSFLYRSECWNDAGKCASYWQY
jgi:hypothetical protein